MVVALLAVLESGAAYVPLDPRHPPLRVAYVLEHAEPRLNVTQA
jgi:non-ribosomal peptide synthetase component F